MVPTTLSAVPVGRSSISFRQVNRKGSVLYDPNLQRHHLIPLQLKGMRCFAPLFDALGRDSVGLDDFRRNGMLLPASDDAVQRLRLPLHRGPHRNYSEMVIERVGRIERIWSRDRQADSIVAAHAARRHFGELQGGLRRELLDQRVPLRLNRNDPLCAGLDFSSLDALAEELWKTV